MCALKGLCLHAADETECFLTSSQVFPGYPSHKQAHANKHHARQEAADTLCMNNNDLLQGKGPTRRALFSIKPIFHCFEDGPLV